MSQPPHFFGNIWQRTKDRQCFVTIPERKQDGFPLAAAVCIALADEPTVRMRSVVRDRGDGSRYAKIMRRGQAALADRFTEGETVRVELIETEDAAETPPTITPAKLKGERNWTDGAIKKFLGEPDELAKNPHYTTAAPMRLYALKRVCATENTPEFQEWQENYLQRKESAKNSAQKAVATKKKKTLEKLDRMKIEFPEFESEEELIRTACDHYNDLWSSRGKLDKRASPHTDSEAFLRRITLNFLRHTCTNYDKLLETMRKQTGINDAVGILHTRIEASAIERHPWLDET